MAVNDLMMRIQLLADTGKSTAELNRLSQQLKTLNSQLKALEQTSLTPLTKNLNEIKLAQSSLKATNLQTFAKTLDDVKKSFSGLGIDTRGVDNLKSAYESLQRQTTKTALTTQKHSAETKVLSDRLKEVKRNQLTNETQSVNQSWVAANSELARYNQLITDSNKGLREEREWLNALKTDLRNVNSLYAQERIAKGQLSAAKLDSNLNLDKNNLKTWNGVLGKAKDDLVSFNNELRKAQAESRKITLKQGISDALGDANSKLSLLSAQQRKYNSDLLTSKNSLTSLKNTLSEIQSNNNWTLVDGKSVRSLSTIKDALKGVKAQQKDALKLKFDPAPLQLFEKMIVRAGATWRKVVPKFDQVSITSLDEYNKQLGKQQQNVLRTQSAVRSYQDVLRGLRSEIQKVGTPDFTVRDGNLLNSVNQIKSAIQSLRSAQSLEIAIDDKGIQRVVKGSLTALQNKLRLIRGEERLNEASVISPIRAQVKAYNSELGVLKQINRAYSEAAKFKNDPLDQVTGEKSRYKLALNDIERLEKALVKLNSKASSYTGNQDLIQRQIQLYEQTASLEGLRGSLAQQTALKYKQQGAEVEKLIGYNKNAIALKNDELKGINNLISAERTRAKLAAQDVKTRSGGLFDTTNSKNQAQRETDLYRGNVAALKQYLSTLKQAAQVRGESFSGKITTLSNELLATLGLESAQKRLISNEQRRTALTQNNLRQNKADREEEIRSIQRITDASKQQNQLIQDGIKTRISSRESDLSYAKSTIAAIKQRIEADKVAIDSYKSGLDSYREGIKQSIAESQQRIASGQLTKQQYGEERTAVRAAISEQKELSKAYQQQLRDQQEKLNLALKAEKANATSIRNQVRDLTQLRTEEARSKAVDLTRQYNQSQTSQGNLRQQIQETESLAKAEIQRNAALLANAKSARTNRDSILGLGQAWKSAAGPASEFMSAISFMFGPQMAGFAAAGSILGLASAFVEANKQVEQLIRGLNAISAGNGRQEFQYLVDISNKLGVSIQESAHSFLQLEATTAGTAVEGAKTKQIFESFSRALNVTGADATTFNRAFRSISQMLSKGQLYAEELKGQLAESLPGAIQVFAKAIDVTPKKFLAMVKAGQFAGQTLYDLLGLVSIQLDKTYKVGSEKDFTFVQKANLAKNAFVELSLAIGETGLWKTLSNGMILIRDALKSATEEVPKLSAKMTAEWELIKTLYGDGANDLIQSLSLVGDGWREISKLIPESISNISFQTLLDLPITIKKAAIDSLAEIKIAALETKLAIDTIFGKDASDTIDIGRGLEMQIQWFKETIASAGEAAGAISIYIDKLKEAKAQRSSIMPDGFKFKPDTEQKLPFDQYLNSYRAIKIDAELEISNDKINKFKKTLSYLQGLLAKETDGDKKQQYAVNINSLESQISAEILLQSQLKDATVQENYNKWQALLKQNEDYNRQSLAKARERNAAENNLQQQANSIRQGAAQEKTKVDQAKQAYDLSVKNATLQGILNKYADYAVSRSRDNQQSIENFTAEKEKDVAISKAQLAYEKKRLDLLQEQRDAQVGFAKNRYQEWVKSGALTQESADFLIKSAEQDNARKAIKDAQDAVAAYNAEVSKGQQASDSELQLLRERAIEVLKLGKEKAKQTNDEYKYNELIKEELRLRSEEKSQINAGAEAVYKAKLKAEGNQVKETLGSIQTIINNSPPPTVGIIVEPKFNEQNLPSQDGLMNASFDKLQSRFQQTQRVMSQPLRVVVDDSQVAASLQDLNQYQTKIQDIRLNSLQDGKTEIIVVPKVSEPSLNDAVNFIKTATSKENVVPLYTNADIPQAQEEGKKMGNAATAAAQESINKAPALKVTTEGSNYDLFSDIGKSIQPQIQKAMEGAKSTVKSSVAEMNQELLTKLGSGGDNGGLKNGLKIQIDPAVDQQTVDGWKYQVKRLIASDANLSFPVSGFQVKAGSWDELVAQGNQYMKLNPSVSVSPETISATAAQVNKGLSGIQFAFDPASMTEEQKAIVEKLKAAGAEGMRVFQNADGTIIIYADNSPALEKTNALIEDINNRSATLKVYVQYVDQGGPSSSTTTPSSPDAKVRWGGHIPGWGGGDRVRALLEPGEFVLRKEAVQALGLDQISKWNRLGGNLRMPRSVDSISIPHFASGGLVGGSPITINVPGSKPIQVTGSRDSAMALANLLTRTGRAL